jgi:hypothetical protein
VGPISLYLSRRVSPVLDFRCMHYRGSVRKTLTGETSGPLVGIEDGPDVRLEVK